jgi:hypothetical protein
LPSFDGSARMRPALEHGTASRAEKWAQPISP